MNKPVGGYAGDIYYEIDQERKRQDEKWGEQNHPDGTSLSFLALADEAKSRFDEAKQFDRAVTWQMILDEEVLEAFAETDWEKLRPELIQVAAVVVAWIECGDRRQGTAAAVSEKPGAAFSAWAAAMAQAAQGES